LQLVKTINLKNSKTFMKSNNQSDVLEVEAIEEMPLENKIEHALVKANVTDAVINQLEERYSGLKLRSIDDKEQYLIIKEARKNVRAVEIIIEKVCKHGREDAVKEQKLWLAKEKTHLQRTAKVLNPLDEEIKKFDDEVERKEIAEKQRKENEYMQRQSALIKYGATFSSVDGGSFVLNHISYEVNLIKDADEEVFQGIILPKYKAEFEKVQAAIVEEENKRKQEQERLQKEKEAFEEQQKQFRIQQEQFEQQQKLLQQQKDEADRQQRLAEQKRIEEENNKKIEVRNNRVSQIRNLGAEYDSWLKIYKFHHLTITDVNSVDTLTDTEWNDLIEKLTPQIDAIKQQLETARLNALEEQKQAAIALAAQQEREKIAEEQRQQEIRKQQEAQRKAEEFALSGDKGMYADVISYLKNYPKHTMKSNIYKGKMNAITQFIENL
jgi:hypothetical protein